MIGNDWDIKLKPVFEGQGFQKFMSVVKAEYKKNICWRSSNWWTG